MRKTRDDGLDRARQQFMDALDQRMPIAQQIEVRHRHDDEARDPRRQRESGLRHAGNDIRRDTAGFLQMILQHANQTLQVGCFEIQIEALVEPGHGHVLAPGKPHGKLLDEGRNLTRQIRHEQQQDQDQQQQQREKHDADREIAAESQALQAVGERIEQIGEHRRDHERRQYWREEIQQHAQQGEQDQHLPTHIHYICSSRACSALRDHATT